MFSCTENNGTDLSLFDKYFRAYSIFSLTDFRRLCVFSLKYMHDNYVIRTTSETILLNTLHNPKTIRNSVTIAVVLSSHTECAVWPKTFS